MTIFCGVQFLMIPAPQTVLNPLKWLILAKILTLKPNIILLLEGLYIVFASVYDTTLFWNFQFLVYWTRDQKTLKPPNATKIPRGGLKIHAPMI